MRGKEVPNRGTDDTALRLEVQAGEVGTGFDTSGGKSGTSPNQQTDVMMDFVVPGSASVIAAAYEDEATSANRSVKAIAICATKGTPWASN